jgi:polysaccharide biosynthesis protein PslH
MSHRRILVVSPTPSHPQTAGNRARVSSLITSLIDLGHDVYFCFIQCEKGDEASMRSAWGSHFFTLPYSRPQKNRNGWKRKIRILFNPEARHRFEIDEWYDPSIDDRISELHDLLRFDAVIVEYVFFSRVLDLFGPDVLKIIDTHDVFTDRHIKYIKNGLTPRWYSTSRDEEAKGLSRADIVLAIQDKEREYFSEMTERKVITVGHLVALHEPIRSEIPCKRILFVASDNTINKDTLDSFISSLLPVIRKTIPDVDFAIAGSICNSVPDQTGVTKLGAIDDLASAYESAAVVINPVRFKTGLSIKNLEALGFSKPLVTSPAGCDGMEDGAGHAFLVAGDMNDFSRNIIRLLTDSDYAHGTAQQAYRYAATRNQKLIGQLQEMLA